MHIRKLIQLKKCFCVTATKKWYFLYHVFFKIKGPGPLVSTPLRHSFQRRRRLPPLGAANRHRLSWTLGGRPDEDSVRRDSRQRWSLHLGDDVSVNSPLFSRQNSPSARSLHSSVSGELNGSRSRAGPWSPLVRGSPVQYRPGGAGSPFRSPSRGRRPQSGGWLASREAISPVPAGGTASAAQLRAVLPELHTSTLIEHGDDPSNVQSVASPGAKSATRLVR
jgi:hypothetical protein